MSNTNADFPRSSAGAFADVYWDGCENQKILVQYCLTCEAFQFYPRAHCHKCYGDRLEWRELSGRGRIYSWTIIHDSSVPERVESAKNALAIVELDEGVRLFSTVGIENENPAIGDRVEVWFDSGTLRGRSIPRFRNLT